MEDNFNWYISNVGICTAICQKCWYRKQKIRHFTSQNEINDKNSEKQNTYVNGMTAKKIYLLTIE
jgi:hypothetical protein